MHRSLRSTLGALALLAALVPASASTQKRTDPPARPAARAATITGTVIDVSCKYAHNLSGAEHRMCAQVCADKGIPLAILGSDGQLYLPVSAGMPGESQNPRLRDFAEQAVTVKGKVFDASGARAIQITSIEPRT